MIVSEMAEFDRQHRVSLKFKHIKVQVITGLFYNEQTDVVVNSTSQKLNLTDGLGSKALFKAAGDQIQSEISAKYPDGVVCGELAISGGHNLYCALVFHCFLKRWTEGDKDNAEKVLKQIVTSSLQEAHEKRDVRSITFPALGRGFSNFKADNVAKLMFQCVADFEESLGTEPTVKDVRFVIFPGDEEEEAKQRSQNVVTTMEYSTDIGNVRFTLVRGSLTKQVCDVVVNETLENLDMSKSPMSKELCAAAGPGLHLSLKQNVGDKIQYGHIAVTGNADLTNCKAVYHGALPLYKESSKVECRQAINIFLMQCFMEATESGYHSISLPPLGTDLKGYSAELSAEAIQGSIIEYLSGNCDETSLQNIYLVVHPSAGNIFKAFKDKMFRYAKGKEKLDKTLIAKPPKQGEPCAPVSVENMPLNLVQMPRMPARGTIQWFIQMYQNDLMTPPYWTYFPGGERLRKLKVDPTFASKGAFKLVDVDQKTLQAIRSLVQKTWNEDSFKHGRDAAGLVDLKYNKIKVMGVKRLENLNLFEKYASFRQQMFGKVVTKSSIFRSPEQIRQSKGQLLTTHHIDPCLTKDIYREINEHYVFHGTKAENIEIILATGLDSRMAGANAMFGQGVYGAESSTKSDQYADDRANRDMSPKSMFLTRMCMGEICVVDKPLRMQRPPCRSCLSLRCKKECRNTKLFDSVLVDGQWIFREMVVYDHAQCYPEFLIKYQRVK
ncbi:PARP10_14_15 [Mytilus edulis]|uniref:Poly [ADP-ribose] polymerase n=1 Tax=Mytilus edulis TaxID=6550 RepID=A0A8S3PZQ6_MYTED|nr:PARP10_14_15 [Mytilus edulis]